MMGITSVLVSVSTSPGKFANGDGGRRVFFFSLAFRLLLVVGSFNGERKQKTNRFSHLPGFRLLVEILR